MAEAISTANSEHYVWGGACDGWHLLKGEDLSVIQERVPPGAAEVRHYHRRSRQFFFILSGEAVIELEDSTVRLREREGLHVPPKVPHRFRNESQADVVFLVISAPKSQGDRVTVE